MFCDKTVWYEVTIVPKAPALGSDPKGNFLETFKCDVENTVLGACRSTIRNQYPSLCVLRIS